VTGKKAGVEKAVEMLTKIQNELVSWYLWILIGLM
jgi:hypothetical protein